MLNEGRRRTVRERQRDRETERETEREREQRRSLAPGLFELRVETLVQGDLNNYCRVTGGSLLLRISHPSTG